MRKSNILITKLMGKFLILFIFQSFSKVFLLEFFIFNGTRPPVFFSLKYLSSPVVHYLSGFRWLSWILNFLKGKRSLSLRTL